MSNGVNNDNNNISIDELRQKLGSVEETFFDTPAKKSIFNSYNEKKESAENALEYLDKDELSKLVDDIKKYDKNGDNQISISEAEIFVKDFNAKHTDSKIQTSDVFGFVEAIFKKDRISNNGVVESSGLTTVGAPLSKKTVKLKFLVEGKVQTIEVEFELYATTNKNMPEVINYKSLSGGEFKQVIAEKYGYTGEKAWSQFINRSISGVDKNTFEIEFQPQFKSTPATQGASGTASHKAAGISADGVDNFVFPEGYDKDPQIIYEQYNKPEVQQIMADTIEHFEGMIAQAEMNLNEYVDSYGFTSKAADLISHLWNNEYINNDGNTESNMRKCIAKAKEMLEKMKNADNSLDGVLNHQDYASYYKELTGVEFNHKYLKNYLDSEKDYSKKKSMIVMYKYVHDNMDKVIQNYENSRESYKSLSEKQKSVDCESGAIMTVAATRDYLSAQNKLYETFQNFLGVSRENWDKMFKEFESRGKDPMEFIKNFADIIKSQVEDKTKSVLGISNLENIDNYESNLQKKYEADKSSAIGKKGDMLSRIDDYHQTQVIGGAVVSGVLQMALYAAGLAALGGVMASGMASGLAYSGSYLVVESTDRLTNNIDNSEDLFNVNSMVDLLGNAGIEFAAGYLFDGILKSKIFGKAEKAALTSEKNNSNNAEVIGQMFLDKSNKRFSKKEIVKILGVRGVAAGVGSTKDGTKEIFKESLKGKYYLGDISAAFLIGAISNAFFIKFKNTDWAKKDHKIMSKFFEKSPKKGTKNDLKYAESVLSKDDYKDFMQILSDIKTSVTTELQKHYGEEWYDEVKHFINEDSNQLTSMILDCYLANVM